MILTVRDVEGFVVVTAEGRLDTGTSADLEGECAGRIESGARRMVLDLSRLEYVSSAGLRVMLALAKRLQAAGGELSLCAATGLVKETLEIAGIGSIVAVHPTLDAAMGQES